MKNLSSIESILVATLWLLLFKMYRWGILCTGSISHFQTFQYEHDEMSQYLPYLLSAFRWCVNVLNFRTAFWCIIEVEVLPTIVNPKSTLIYKTLITSLVIQFYKHVTSNKLSSSIQIINVIVIVYQNNTFIWYFKHPFSYLQYFLTCPYRYFCRKHRVTRDEIV